MLDLARFFSADWFGTRVYTSKSWGPTLVTATTAGSLLILTANEAGLEGAVRVDVTAADEGASTSLGVDVVVESQGGYGRDQPEHHRGGGWSTERASSTR